MTDDAALFENAVKNNHLNFADWAGAEEVSVGDRDVVGRAIYPDGGDIVVFDTRGRTGFIGIHHDNWSDIHPIKIKNAKDKGYNLRQKKLPRQVPTLELIKRYLWITNVFLDWLHVAGGSPFDMWKTPDEIDAAFGAEAQDFAQDPYLALYWVMHFGLCGDPRYADLAQTVRAQGHDQNNDKMRMALAFFDTTEVDHDIDLTPRYNPGNKDYAQLFLRRRANLLYMTYGQSFRGGGAAEPLWQSVALYRRCDDHAIIRMRWLRNNLAKFDLWDVLRNRLDDPDSDDIPFISYPRIFQPQQTQTAALADKLVAEVLDTRPMWSNRFGAFGKAILHDVRNHVGDKSALRAAAVIVFDGDMGNAQFAEILASLGEEGFGSAAVREKLATFEGMFDGIRNLLTDKRDRIDAIFAQADALLGGLSQSDMVFFVGASTQHNATQVLLRHVLLNEVPDREDHIVSLFPRAAFADHELKSFFGVDHPPLVTTPDGPVVRALLRVLALPETAFAAEHRRQRAVQSVCDLMRGVLHEPDVFDPVIAQMERSDSDVVCTTLLEYMFRHNSRAAAQPLDHLSQDQVARLMAAALAHAQKNPDDFRKGLRLIVECTAQHPATVSDPKARFFKDLLVFTQTPDAAFGAPLDRADALSAVFRALCPAAQVPAVFDRLMALIEADMPEGTARAIFDGVFVEYAYEPERNPVLRLERAQVERMLQTTLDYALRRPEKAREALQVIRACAAPDAKDWLTRTRADTSVFKRLEAYQDNFVPLSLKLEDALEDALETIADQDEAAQH